MDSLFQKYSPHETRRNQPQVIRAEVDSQGEDYLLNVSEDDLVAALIQKFEWDPPVLGEPELASHREIECKQQYNDFGERRTRSVRLMEIIVHVPYVGDKAFFLMQPPTSQWSTPKANVRSDCLEIVFELQNTDGEKVKNLINEFVADVRYHLNQLVQIAREHNSGLEQMIRAEVQARKKRILDRRNLVASIGLPLRSRENSPQTYSVPGIRRKPEVVMPKASHQAFAPEPKLADTEYENILSIIKSMVRVMEASPHAFSSMKEEDLRQHFLVQLNGQYHGGATGETFNYEGKTDILIREKERNVFIGECKFWKGPESLTKTIDQCLGYLHWRDTKAAIVMFNRNKDFTNVLSQIEPTAKAHPGFKHLVRQAGETEWRFIFANRDDPNREVHLAIMAFDIPKAP